MPKKQSRKLNRLTAIIIDAITPRHANRNYKIKSWKKNLYGKF